MGKEIGKNMPEKKFRAGAISATIWSNVNEVKKGDKFEAVEFKTVAVVRNYKDKKDEWKTTNSFRINDLPKVALAVSKAYEYLVLKDQALEMPE